jgi:hypothetical protein
MLGNAGVQMAAALAGGVVRVHFGKDRTEQYKLLRVEQPKDEKQEGPA